MSAIYKIIGEDGKEYGPVTADQIRQWITQNRLERQSPVFVEGAKDWNFIGLLPEFSGYFTGNAPQTIAPVVQQRKTNPCATAGLVFGILSLVLICCCGGLPFNILGLIFSIIALVQISEHPELYQGRGIAIAGLVLSAATLLFVLVALISGHPQINLING
jgi:hypothetical protein